MSKYDKRNKILEQIKEKYGPRIVAWMNNIRTALVEKQGATCGTVEDTSGDEYKWSLDISFVGHDTVNDFRNLTDKHGDGVDLGMDFEITEAAEYEGDGDDKGLYGVTFAFRGVYFGGRVFGIGLTPHNYTERCWVDMRDANAVEQRFVELESHNAEMVAEAIKEQWDNDREPVKA